MAVLVGLVGLVVLVVLVGLVVLLGNGETSLSLSPTSGRSLHSLPVVPIQRWRMRGV